MGPFTSSCKRRASAFVTVRVRARTLCPHACCRGPRPLKGSSRSHCVSSHFSSSDFPFVSKLARTWDIPEVTRMARHRAGAVTSAGWPSLLRGLSGSHRDGDTASYCREQADGRHLRGHRGFRPRVVAGRSHLVWVQSSVWLCHCRCLSSVAGRLPVN